MNEDIIVAVATSRLEAAISIIRISGPESIAFVQKFFTGKIINKESHTISKYISWKENIYWWRNGGNKLSWWRVYY